MPVIQLHFLEPFRLIEWTAPEKRTDKNHRWLRGQTFARWHKDKKAGHDKPYITGTLLRSALIRAAEEELARPNTQWQSCGGHFFTKDGEKPMHLRHRATIGRNNDNECCRDRDNACHLCLLLGYFDNTGKGKAEKVRGKQFDVRFGNFSLQPNDLYFSKPADIGVRRTLNRVDDHSGKAHDFFSIWEIDGIQNFYGEITLAEDLPKKEEVEKLIKRSLGFVDRICGALCRVEIITQKQQQGTETQKTSTAVVDSNDLVSHIVGYLPDLAYGRMRTLADAIRNLRQRDICSFSLPLGRSDRDGKRTAHYVWDTVLTDGQKLRDILTAQAKTCENDQSCWRRFCEDLGQKIYLKSKGLKDSPGSPGRHLGGAEQVRPAREPDSYDKHAVNPSGFTREWIITGDLKAETPFFIGMDSPMPDDQISSRVLVNRENHYRMPRSTMRGILRRDLSLAFGGQGCRVELGSERPCSCPVCRMLRQLTVADSISDCCYPADISQRVRKNPLTGTVLDGGLFDTETGLQGMEFPFVLRYRGESLPKEMEAVLSWWQDEKCFIGGDGGTGRGRFSLRNINIYTWDLTESKARESYAESCGLRGEETDLSIYNDKELGELEEGLTRQHISHISTEFPWTKISWSMEFHGPVLNADPLAALNDDVADSVYFQRTVIKNGDTKTIPVLKGEGLRGLLRTAVGRVAGGNLLTSTHEDCQCILCRLFGNEHQAGIIRVEDMLPTGKAPDKRMDHVSIDRFDQSVVEKFDDRPLVGSPDKPLTFAGAFWLKEEELTESMKTTLSQAIKDIQSGLYPVGGKGGIGYGWPANVAVDWNVMTHQETADTVSDEGDTIVTNIDLQPAKQDSLPSPASVVPNGRAIYYPHYFLPVDENNPPQRDFNLIGHDNFTTGSFTGKLSCTLEVLTPLIIPDTEAEQAKDEHHEYDFFAINNEPMIPGAPLRAMISQVYEAITNSCFRVADQKRYLSWRMDAEDAPEHYIPGRVTANKDGSLKIERMLAFRLPLYDDPQITAGITNDEAVATCRDQDQEKLKKAKKFNSLTAALAAHNREFIRQLQEAGKERKPVKFNLKESNSPHDYLVELHEKGSYSGYIKITGPNNANVELAGESNHDRLADVQNFLDFTLSGPPECRVSNKRQYPRPGYSAVINGHRYTISKRCERIFSKKGKDKNEKECSVKEQFPLSSRVITRYRQLVQENEKNTSHLYLPLTSRVNDTLEHGSLVYFRLNSRQQATDIIPVAISREADDRPLGKRLPSGFQSCSHVCLEDCNTCSAKNCPIPLYREGYPSQGLCPACKLFGAQMYKGRLRFSFAKQAGDIQTRKITLPLLERPRPTWVLPKQVKGNETTVPGRKFYLRHNGWQGVANGKDPITGEKIKPGPNNATVSAVMPEAQFTFDIMCENLSKKELGFLLYCLELEQGMAHALGRGKPLGFGSVRITVNTIEQRLLNGKWQNLPSTNHKAVETPIVLEALQSLNHGHWQETSHIKGLRMLLTPQPKLSVRYPKLSQKETAEPPGYEELKNAGNYDANQALRVSDNGLRPWFHG